MRLKEAHVEDAVLCELLRTFGSRFKGNFDFLEMPMSKTMLEQLARLHDAELTMVSEK